MSPSTAAYNGLTWPDNAGLIQVDAMHGVHHNASCEGPMEENRRAAALMDLTVSTAGDDWSYTIQP
jgi:hypothetical protein